MSFQSVICALMHTSVAYILFFFKYACVRLASTLRNTLTNNEGKGKSMTQIIALAGSLRSQSYNKNLVKIAAKGAEEQGADVV